MHPQWSPGQWKPHTLSKNGNKQTKKQGPDRYDYFSYNHELSELRSLNTKVAMVRSLGTNLKMHQVKGTLNIFIQPTFKTVDSRFGQ